MSIIKNVSYDCKRYCAFSELQGKTITEILVEEHLGEMVFITKCGKTYQMYHEQDCCETVYIESIVGDMLDLLDTPILMAEEVDGEVTQDDYGDQQYTFYKLATIKGYVDIRFVGSSNGYYSTSVSFYEVLNEAMEKDEDES